MLKVNYHIFDVTNNYYFLTIKLTLVITHNSINPINISI
jgi:hypothetical protein